MSLFLPLARAACRRQASTHQGEAALSAGDATHHVLLLRNGDAEDKRREGATTRLIAWLDGVLGSGDGEKEHGGILSGAQRRYGVDDPRANLVLEAGNLHGVSDDTSP